MTGPLHDPVEEARRIVAGADAAGIDVRAVGGVGVALVAPSVGRLRPPREYHDLDLVAPAGTSRRLDALFEDLGYEPARRFNALNGVERLLYHDSSGRRVDVFLDVLRMCHVLKLERRLVLAPLTLTPTDLLLTKLQIVEITERDGQDVIALLADHPTVRAVDEAHGISIDRLAEVCARDWGWWRTVDGNLARLAEGWAAQVDTASAGERSLLSSAIERAGTIRGYLAATPKSLAWRIRARIGDRQRWYELPEEVR